MVCCEVAHPSYALKGIGMASSDDTVIVLVPEVYVSGNGVFRTPCREFQVPMRDARQIRSKITKIQLLVNELREELRLQNGQKC